MENAFSGNYVSFSQEHEWIVIIQLHGPMLSAFVSLTLLYFACSSPKGGREAVDAPKFDSAPKL
jgi:hypothetical protein